ncbi:MAG: hypothetical protein HY583_00025 [Candidatus Omnitrophica bacterium]|nr:hypothetical protein [Candidatus Omnitrophota bacterium]
MRKKTCLLLVSAILFNSSFLAASPFSIPNPIPGESQSISIAGSTVKIKGLTHQANKCFLNGREVLIQPDGAFYEETIIPLGETELTILVVDPEGRTARYSKKIKAKENDFFLVGLIDGTLNFIEVDERFSWERDSKSYPDDGFHPDGKISYYAGAKLFGKYLFKSSLDTEKTTQDKLFTYIDPDKYYPIYGDNSTVVYDVNSQGPFYALFEWDKSVATFGNYQTQIGNEDSKLLNYNRTLYGGKVHIETPKRTVYGDSVTQFKGFWAEANQQAGHSELLATGGSLYYFRHRNIAEGSEQIRLEVRDKNSGMTIYTIPQASGVDYEMKYDEGRILFKKPILSIAPSDTIISASVLEGNPVYVLANYEYKNQDAFLVTLDDLDNQSAGFQFSQHLGNHVRAGVTHVQEQKDGKYYKLTGGDTTLKLGNFTQVNAEVANSRADSTKSYISYGGGYEYSELSADNLVDGTAVRVQGNSSLGEYFGKEKGFLDLSGYWQKISRDFSSADSLFEAGARKYGLDLSHNLTQNDRLRFLYSREDLAKGFDNDGVENQIQAKRLQDFTGQWNHRWNQFTFTSEYLFKDEKESLSPIRDAGKGHVKGHLVGERVQYDLSKRTSVYLGQQVGINDLNDSFTIAGISKKITDKLSVSAQAGAGPMGNSVMAGVEKTVDQNTSAYSHYTITNSHTDGRTSITSFGSNSKVSENAKLRRERQVITSDSRSTYRADLVGYEQQITPELYLDASSQRRDEKQSPNTVSGAGARDAHTASIFFVVPDRVKFQSKNEHRLNSDDMWQVLFDNQGEVKVTKDFFLFGEHEYSRTRKSISGIDKKQVGIAFRPVNYDWFNALFKYIRLGDDRPEDLGSADGGFLVTQSKSDVLAEEHAIDLPLHFQIVQKLAFKKEDFIAQDPTNLIRTTENLEAFLWIHRLNYHLTNRIDIAAEYRRLRQRGSAVQSKEHGLLFEIMFQIVKHIGIGVGFNGTSFTDDLLATKDHKSARGFFFRFQGKY